MSWLAPSPLLEGERPRINGHDGWGECSCSRQLFIHEPVLFLASISDPSLITLGAPPRPRPLSWWYQLLEDPEYFDKAAGVCGGCNGTVERKVVRRSQPDERRTGLNLDPDTQVLRTLKDEGHQRCEMQRQTSHPESRVIILTHPSLMEDHQSALAAGSRRCPVSD